MLALINYLERLIVCSNYLMNEWLGSLFSIWVLLDVGQLAFVISVLLRKSCISSLWYARSFNVIMFSNLHSESLFRVNDSVASAQRTRVIVSALIHLVPDAFKLAQIQILDCFYLCTTRCCNHGQEQKYNYKEEHQATIKGADLDHRIVSRILRLVNLDVKVFTYAHISAIGKHFFLLFLLKFLY